MRHLPFSADGLEHPRRQLAHLVSSRPPGYGNENVFNLRQIAVPRPHRGRTTATVRCHTCREPVRVLVHSRGETRSLRAAHFARGSGCVAIATVVTVYTLNTSRSSDAVLVAILLPLMILLAIFGLSRITTALDEDGVRLLDGESDHSLREPGGTRESHSPETSD